MIDFKSKIQGFKDWVIEHKTLSISLPIVLVLSSFFVIENIKDYQSISVDSEESKGFNSSLPSSNAEKSTKLEDEALWRQSTTKEDNQNSKTERSPELLEKAQKEDSLKKVLKELEDISFDLEQNQSVISEGSPAQEKNGMEGNNGQGGKMDETLEARLNYRELLREGKEKMLETNSLNPPSLLAEKRTEKSTLLQVRVKVYRDQFVLPDDRVQLIVTEDFKYEGKIIPKNTFFYALASVQGNRVLLDADNINHIPIKAILKDYRDGMEGIYSERAGGLWGEYMAETQNRAVTEINNEFTNELGGNLNSLVTGLGSFLKRKKLRERDKILLINDHELLMTIE
ncbi:conjugative transposon protein TraM [Maribacter arenosus]|uniref:Conjugative transposon protein TraM n=1 Tax=Maribacter arenosus TaxID=1854708 RepID=A0ABR7VF60_9FLAO|nr:conjugative transposon protein TraM [Maribacter arenosus]MBD0851946.1 conjugative transposon protein TraM [Maribacter arenosus]